MTFFNSRTKNWLQKTRRKKWRIRKKVRSSSCLHQCTKNSKNKSKCLGRFSNKPSDWSKCFALIGCLKASKRKENASYRAKLFGSNTDLDKIGLEPTPTKPKRNPIRKTLELGRKSISFEKTLSTPTQNSPAKPTRSREISADSSTAIVPSICFASSMPIYIGDQIIERNGAKCHQRFIDDFNRIKTKGAKVWICSWYGSYLVPPLKNRRMGIRLSLALIAGPISTAR